MRQNIPKLKTTNMLIYRSLSTPGIVRALLRRRSFKKNDQKKGA